MATILNKDYFDGGELNIPGTEQDAVAEKIADFINKYEPQYLQKALGYPLWKLFKADPYTAPVHQRFIDLLNGDVEFTDRNGRTQLWTGLKDTILSPISIYVWYWYQRNNASFNSSQGEVKGKSENSVSVSIALKQTRAWNEMSNITCLLWEFLACAKTGAAKTYPEFDIYQTGNFGKINYHNI